MASETQLPPQPSPSPFTSPNAPRPAPPRDPAAVITELMRRNKALPRSRDENAFIDLQKNCH
jgi:hypothetical protein